MKQKVQYRPTSMYYTLCVCYANLYGCESWTMLHKATNAWFVERGAGMLPTTL